MALWRADVRLQNLRVTDPDAPLQNLFEIAEATLDLDGDALLQRKLIIREGRVSGLRFDTRRQTSGAVIRPPRQPDEGGSLLPAFDIGWLRAAAGRLQDDWESQLQTIKLSEQLLQRWPEEYRQLEQRAEQLKQRIEKLRDMARELKQSNPLRSVELVQQATEEVQAIRVEVERVPRDVKRLREQVVSDRDAMVAAKDHDLEFVKKQLKLEGFDAQSLTHYLLDQEQADQVTEILAWIQWARQCLPAKSQAYQPQRQRGRTITFPGMPRLPKLLAEQLAVSGEAQWQGQTLPFQGQLSGLTTDPHLYGRPATLMVQTGGPHPVQVNAVVDRTTATAHDRLTIQCPQLTLPARNLGDRDALTVSVAAAPAALHVELDLRDQALAGQIRVRQQQVQLQAAVSRKCGGEQLATRLNRSVSRIQSLDVTLDVRGTLSHPQWSVESNLGPQLAEGVQLVLREELALRSQQVTQKLNQQLDRQLAKLDELVAAKSAKLFGDSQAVQAELDHLARSFVGRLNIAERLPLPKQFQNLPQQLEKLPGPLRQLPGALGGFPGQIGQPPAANGQTPTPAGSPPPASAT